MPTGWWVWAGARFLHQEAAPLGPPYHGSPSSIAQDHDVVFFQGHAVACKGRAGRFHRWNSRDRVCCGDVGADRVAWDRTTGAHVVVEQFDPWRGHVRPDTGDADMGVVEIV